MVGDFDLIETKVGDAAVRARRRVEPLAGGLVWIEEEMQIEGRLPGGFVTGAGWMFELHTLHRGTVSFVQDGASVAVDAGRFGLFFAPFSITAVEFEDVWTTWVGVAGAGRVPGARESRSVLIEVASPARPANARELFALLDAPRGCRSIERATRPSTLSRRAKSVLDESYRSSDPISALAARLNVSHPHLARQFKRDYGTSPVAYRHSLRASEASQKLSLGEQIIDVSGDVGYNDLGRFYKQFRKLLKTSPGRCRTF